MTVWATPWEFLWGVMGWVMFLLCIAGFIILVFAILVGFARGLKGIFKPFRRSNQGQHRAE